MKKKRDIFGELTEGMAALKEQREGKVTLRTFKMESKLCRSSTSCFSNSCSILRCCDDKSSEYMAER